MDYKKKYNEAQKWIESIYTELSHEQQMEAEAFFPELKDSEDEKMMHQLHSWMKEFGGAEEYTEKVYTWLKSLIEKQGEQEPTDKVEPKFKVGDYIKHNKANIICKIISVNSGSYYVENIETSGRIELFNAEQNFHLWTIQDAKDGDVLAGKIDGDNYILIFKQIKDGWVETYGHYYDAVDRFCVPSQLFCRDYKGTFHPATKEQRDTLFAKMTEAGYEWDAEKKELKKISQRMVSAEAKEALYDKPAWSEEDETGWTNTMIMIKEVASSHYTKDSIKLVIDWLKSLKERYTWKPSEEQIECLYDAINHYQTNGYPASKLNELYEQMSKIYKL